MNATLLKSTVTQFRNMSMVHPIIKIMTNHLFLCFFKYSPTVIELKGKVVLFVKLTIIQEFALLSKYPSYFPFLMQLKNNFKDANPFQTR